MQFEYVKIDHLFEENEFSWIILEGKKETGTVHHEINDLDDKCTVPGQIWLHAHFKDMRRYGILKQEAEHGQRREMFTDRNPRTIIQQFIIQQRSSITTFQDFMTDIHIQLAKSFIHKRHRIVREI